jgi:hypothetical protein
MVSWQTSTSFRKIAQSDLILDEDIHVLREAKPLQPLFDVTRHGMSLRGPSIAHGVGGQNGSKLSLNTLQFHGALPIPERTQGYVRAGN